MDACHSICTQFCRPFEPMIHAAMIHAAIRELARLLRALAVLTPHTKERGICSHTQKQINRTCATPQSLAVRSVRTLWSVGQPPHMAQRFILCILCRSGVHKMRITKFDATTKLKVRPPLPNAFGRVLLSQENPPACCAIEATTGHCSLAIYGAAPPLILVTYPC
jgi:hypothetical protein